tara:strand:+ start:746 stop:994 length:249 start_codon:yes stop_codon:yes gene_type:complete
MPRPKSHYRQGKFKGMLKDKIPQTYTKTPDIDNLIKMVLDSLQGDDGFFIDDKQVVELNSIKRYIEEGEEPRTIVMIDNYEG